MIYNYLYQDKLFKNKEIVYFSKENKKSKKIKFSLSVTKLFFSNFKKFFREILKYFYEFLTTFDYFLETYKKKNTEKNNKCIFLGNGPSLNKIKKSDLMKFQINGNKVFAVNYWHENKKYKNIIPNYLIISDPKIFQSKSDFNNVNLYKRKINLLKYIKKHPNIILILSPKCIRYAKSQVKNKILTFSDSELDFIYSSVNPFLPRSYSSVSIVNGLSIAKWLNFSKIFLIGIDNSYFRYLFSNKNNNILYLDIHSYDDKFIVDYSERYHSMFDYFYDHIKVFKSYEKLGKVNNIFNLDEYSLTSFFKKKEISYINK